MQSYIRTVTIYFVKIVLAHSMYCHLQYYKLSYPVDTTWCNSPTTGASTCGALRWSHEDTEMYTMYKQKSSWWSEF